MVVRDETHKKEIRDILLKNQKVIIYLSLIFALSIFSSASVSIPQHKDDYIYSTDPKIIGKGDVLFQQNCSACHNFVQKGIGPNLSGITSEVSVEWLFKFITNAQKTIEEGDPRAVKLLEEYKSPMPSFSHFNKEEIGSILSFLHTKKKSLKVSDDQQNLGPALSDPIPAKIEKSGFTLDLQSHLTAPATSNKIPFARINQMRVLPGEKDRAFISDMNGQLYELKNHELSLVLDISKTFPDFIPNPGLASGFGSYAFHPEFHSNGLFYTTHTEKRNDKKADFNYADSIPVALQWVLSEWRINDPKSSVFSGTNREILRIDMVTPIHGVQEIIFNPNAKPSSDDYGLLYIGIGDGGAAENRYTFLCNSNTTVWSSILRIDPRGSNSKNGRYGIPEVNPFAMDGDLNTLGEIYASGFRNPNRISWTKDGKMLITDIGLTQVEELNIGKAGANYGWPAREGSFLLNYKGNMNKVYALPHDDDKYNYTYPVAQFDHDEGNAISGGFLYTGTISLLKDKYIFGDIVSGRIFYVENSELELGKQAPIKELELRFDGKSSTFRDMTNKGKSDLRIGVGLNHVLYFYTKTDGKMWLVSDVFGL